jgi:putative heme-binding domain-containing protein
VELTYASKVALRDALIGPGGYTFASKIAVSSDALTDIADVSLAVPTSEAADFLIRHLERTNFQAPRAGEYLRHVVLQIQPADRVREIVGKLEKIGSGASLPQCLAMADGLNEAARKRGLKLPESAQTWVQQTLATALTTADPALLDKAIAAVKDAKLDAKLEPLRTIVQRAGEHGPRRAAALDALMNLPQGREIATAALNDPSSMTLRKRAAELLGQAKDDRAAREALIAALPVAPWELATVIAAGLAKSDSGAEQLIAMLETGKSSPALLRNNAVAGSLAGRPQALRDRAATLTKDLPPEDARLDGVIAKRVEEFRVAQPDAAHGAQVFQQNCAACHKVKSQGGNVGPNLDGVGSRGVHRLVEDILDPNRNVDPAFRQTIIETADGRTLAGVNLRTEGELVLVNDVTGQEQSVPKAQLKSQTQSKLSLMPPVFEQTLGGKDFNDLLAFLLNESAATR